MKLNEIHIRDPFVFAEDGTLSLTVAVCGFYELYLNGEKVTRGRLAPYIANPDDYVYADTYTFEVEKGENVKKGDIACLFGKELPLRKVCNESGISAYRLLTGISSRVPRIYLEDGQRKELR